MEDENKGYGEIIAEAVSQKLKDRIENGFANYPEPEVNNPTAIAKVKMENEELKERVADLQNQLAILKEILGGN